MTALTVRRATTADIGGIQRLIQPYVEANILLGKSLVVLYEAVQEFQVAELEGELVGCGALHVMWRDLGEIRTIATSSAHRGHGIGGALLEALKRDALDLGLSRLFCLTFETSFFARHGFEAVDEQVVDEATYRELMRSTDVGVHEFLDLPYVKPNTLGNTRMICDLHAR